MTEKEIKDLLEQAKKNVEDEEIIINYYYDTYTELFYVTSAKPMTNIIWKRRYKVNDGILKYMDSLLAYFNC